MITPSVRFGKYAFVFVLLGFFLPPAAAMQAENPASYHDERTGLSVATGEITLKGWYFPAPTKEGAALAQPVIVGRERLASGEKETDDWDFDDDAMDPRSQSWRYRFGGLLRDSDASSIDLTFVKADDQSEVVVTLDLAAARANQGERVDFESWAKSRFLSWSGNGLFPLPSIMQSWQNRSKSIYGTEFDNPYDYDRRFNSRSRGWRDDEPDLGSMAIFGGQVAINETLQTQLIASLDEEEKEETGAVPLAALPRVEVASHPYAVMIKERNVPKVSPSLADYVPADRFMLMMREPGRFANLFELDGVAFERLTSLLGSSFVDYGLLERYAARFGLTERQLRRLLARGNVAESVLFTPDVFFLDSTDITVLIRFKPHASWMLDLGLDLRIDLANITSIPLPDGNAFYTTRLDDLLLFSTRKEEIESVLRLAKANGAGSLGRSDEFRLMTHELPPAAEAGMYVYFSDPFIRRLTGPEIKIGQLRRAQARARLQDLTSTALLYRLDQGADATLDDMKRKGYLAPEEFRSDEFTLAPGAVASSRTWGRLAQLRTLLDNPVTTVTYDEAEAYTSYVRRYERFWSEYFDPIAVRLDMTAEGVLRLETFILPLIDNSFYDSLKEMLGGTLSETTVLPIYETPPVTSLALHLREKLDARMLGYPFRGYSRPMAMLQEGLNDTLIVSIRDAAPIVQVPYPGSMGEDSGLHLFGSSSEEMIIIPLMSALFTRPVDAAMEIRDETKVKAALDSLFFPSEREIRVEQLTYTDDGTRVYTVNIVGLIRLEYSVKIENGWLHFSNHPWSPVAITGRREVPSAHASLELNPSSVKEGLIQNLRLFQSVYRNAIYASADELLPWMQAYGLNSAEAAEIQKKALGRATPLPPEVTVETTPFTTVAPYGSRLRQTMPADETASTPLPGLHNLMLWMRFEGSGLRSRLEFAPPKPEGETAP